MLSHTGIQLRNRECTYRFACHSERPRNRFIRTPDGEQGFNNLCPAYKRFFDHVDPYKKRTAELLHAGHPAAAIMERLRGSAPKAR